MEKVVPASGLDAEVDAWLDQLAQCAPQAVRLQKRLIRAWEDLPVRAAVQAGVDAFEAAARTGEPAAAMADFLARRAAAKAKGA